MSGPLTISYATAALSLINTTASSNSNFKLGSDITSNGSGMALFGSTFTSSSQYRQNGGYVYTNQAGGLTLHAEGANSMYLATNGTAAITISSAQILSLTSTIFTAAWGNAGGDYTGITNPSYKVNPSSSYWRIAYLSQNSTVSGVYNYETGKNVYWGEPTDTGSYYFRGRLPYYTNSSSIDYQLVYNTGSWGISITGNANTATTATTATNWSGYNAGLLNWSTANGTSTNGQNRMAARLYSLGRKIYLDETFNYGANSLNIYDNNGTGTVSITRVSAPYAVSTSGYQIQIQHTGAAQSPGYGGFYFATQTRSNATLACVFRAKLPSGYTLNWASNAIGSGGNNYWVTDNYGTGKYEDYVYVVRCGDSGSFSSTMFFYISGSPAPSAGSPLTWYLSSATVYDVDDRDNTNTQGYTPLTSNNYTSYSPTLTGTGASGTWAISISGNSATTSQTTFSSLSATGIIYANSGNDSSTSNGAIQLWGTTGTPATTSWMGFKNVANTGWGYHGGVTSTGAYATYYVMDTASRGWIWRYSPTNNFAGTNVASIQNDTGQMALGSVYDGTGSNPTFAQLNVCNGRGAATNYRDIDIKGSWAAGEGHSITATHGSTSTNIVGQITFQHDSPGSRIRFGKLYATGDQTSYPMELISNSTGAGGNLYVTGDITAYYSDERLKTKVAGIDNALNKVLSLSGFKYINNALAKEHGYDSDKVQIGMSAQEVQKVAPEIVKLAHFDMEIVNGGVTSKSGENYLTLDYSKLVPILVEAIKEQQGQIEELRKSLFNIIDSK